MKRLLAALLLTALTLRRWPPGSGATDGRSCPDAGGKARFVETKYIALLDKPLMASGEMTFTTPDRLEKRHLTPRSKRCCSTRTG
jgi:hypothetical protein